MSEIVLSAEQTRLIANAKGPVAVRTESGDVLGVLEPITLPDEQEIAEVQARLSRHHQRYSLAQVLAKLEAGSK